MNSWKLENVNTTGEMRLARAIDVVVSLGGIIFLFPLALAIAIGIWLEDGFPIFFSLDKIGKDGARFRTHKFRSLVHNAEKIGSVFLAESDARITKIGRVLRATALDELPQILNVLKGDMSFVGPRPFREAFENQWLPILPTYHLRYLVRPGLTGLAQVYGKKYLTPRQRLRFDLLYIRNQSVCLYVKLLLLSVWFSFRGKWESRSNKFK